MHTFTRATYMNGQVVEGFLHTFTRATYINGQVVEGFPGVKIGSYPVNGMQETVVTFEWLQGAK